MLLSIEIDYTQQIFSQIYNQIILLLFFLDELDSVKDHF